MRIVLVFVGKTDEEYIKEGCKKYFDRLSNYMKVEEFIVLPPKSIYTYKPAEIKMKEGEELIKALSKMDRAFVVLLDEQGKEYSSVDFSKYMNKIFSQSYDKLVFVVGGGYGFSEDVYKKYPQKISLSKLTFTHQMIRLLLVEQIYRAMTILKNEKYHHL
ncbi:MAG: 23S rRNA (pseudouridine(1915)-N(3))-methyltransferase RlmH [Bacteroidetes bacterium]|nr:23S rRNA (pseudouridine(1915)-N(3))-methyltransferase RlmH [Bacteroidota bacterium]